MKKLWSQVIRFGIVGAVATIIDYGLMVALTELVGLLYLLSCAISFLISVIVNYILSIRFVFTPNKNISKTVELVVFILLSAIGLGINQAIMWFTVEQIKISYLIAKIVATGIVMIYNFISRKLFLEKKSC